MKVEWLKKQVTLHINSLLMMKLHVKQNLNPQTEMTVVVLVQIQIVPVYVLVMPLKIVRVSVMEVL